jgi:hypothetical protein
MKTLISRTIIILSLLATASFYSFSQESTKISPYVQLQYFKDNNDNSSLKTTLTYSENRMEIPLKGMKIIFYAGNEKKNRIAEVVTDEKGVAVCNLKEKSDFSADASGQWAFSTDFEGNDTIESASAELSIRDLILKMDLAEVDSVKTLSLNAMMIENGRELPASGEMLTVYVPRMFSLLPIGDVILDDSGNGSLEFPADLPGDKEGNITIIARFEEHPEFGNVEKTTTLKWGVPSSYSVPQGHRALWTKVAPLWMIYTLSVLLTGVWGHYLFALISLIRIRRNAKKTESGDPRSI